MPCKSESNCSLTPTMSLGFFKLPVEIRQQIYRLVLCSSSDIFVPYFAFKRRKHNHDNQPSKSVCALHSARSTHCGNPNLCCRLPGTASLPSHPTQRTESSGFSGIKVDGSGKKLRVDLLQTCHLIYIEASTVFYAENVFCFEDATAGHALRWSSSYAIFVRKIHIVLRAIYTNYDSRLVDRADRSWTPYLRAERFSLNKDFPNLSHLTITLGRGLEASSRWAISNVLEPFRRYLRVRTLEIVGLNDKELLPALGVIVHPPSTPDQYEKSTYKVQSFLSGYKEMVGWTNAIFWWGRDGEERPVEPRRFAGDSRYRRKLYSIGSGSPSVPWLTVGESFLENGSC